MSLPLAGTLTHDLVFAILVYSEKPSIEKYGLLPV
jgi:hypothetical protein